MTKYRCEINTNYKWSDLYCFNVRFYHVLQESNRIFNGTFHMMELRPLVFFTDGFAVPLNITSGYTY